MRTVQLDQPACWTLSSHKKRDKRGTTVLQRPRRQKVPLTIAAPSLAKINPRGHDFLAYGVCLYCKQRFGQRQPESFTRFLSNGCLLWTRVWATLLL